jgi:hypothetical protein
MSLGDGEYYEREVGLTQPTCGSCRFYSHGKCHRHAPIKISETLPGNGIWPYVGWSDWCGDHEPKAVDPEGRFLLRCSTLEQVRAGIDGARHG